MSFPDALDAWNTLLQSPSNSGNRTPDAAEQLEEQEIEEQQQFQAQGPRIQVSPVTSIYDQVAPGRGLRQPVVAAVAPRGPPPGSCWSGGGHATSSSGTSSGQHPMDPVVAAATIAPKAAGGGVAAGVIGDLTSSVHKGKKTAPATPGRQPLAGRAATAGAGKCGGAPTTSPARGGGGATTIWNTIHHQGSPPEGECYATWASAWPTVGAQPRTVAEGGLHKSKVRQFNYFTSTHRTRIDTKTPLTEFKK